MDPNVVSHSTESSNENRTFTSKQEGSAKAPLLLGSLPILANFLFNGSKTWIEIVFIIMVMIWVYYILEAPWKAYYNSRKLEYSKSERIYIVMIFISPWIAAYSIHVAKLYFSSKGPTSNLLNDFSIPIFLLAAIIRPFSWLVQETKEQRRAGSGPDELNELRYQVGRLMDRIDYLEQGKSPVDKENLMIEKADGGRGLTVIEEEMKKKLRTMSKMYERRLMELELQILAVSGRANNESSILGLGYQLFKAVLVRMISIFFLPLRIFRSLINKLPTAI